ncbi:toll-like receptor 2 [Lingula anatina]|uniref:Toll-like receptor 2 n=1 Tax=Lingula anatina TaxID=7574 RepID=A0A1S3KCL1_LINAN|nr:toll-like receptor 2 [Lingula anatina]|eukprot:XP_013420232.1 toll-like receptor 2 [Lingula anatina]
MTYTGLTKVTPGTFKPLQNLRTLDLSDNKLVEIDGDIFYKYIPKLATFLFNNNRFSCDCHLVRFVGWLKHTSIQISGEDQPCFSPSKLSAVKVGDYSPGFLECKIGLQVLLYALGTLVLLIFTAVITFYRWDIRFWWQFKVRPKKTQGYIPIDGEFDAFVSYSSKDEDWVVGTLVRNLEESEARFQLCLDNRDLIPGNFIIDNLIQGMEKSKCCLFVITRNFVKSEWCNFELNTAISKMLDERKNVVILIYLEHIPDKDLPKNLRRLKKHVTHLKWPNDEGQRKIDIFWKKLQLVLYHKKETFKQRGTVTEEAV